MPTIKHSDKALATLTQLATTPEQWVLTEIKWVEEERLVPGQVKCPECGGHKWVRYDAEGKPIARPPEAVDRGNYREYYAAQRLQEEYDHLARKEFGGGYYGNCKRCKGTRGRWHGIPKGTVSGMVLAKVKVGYPQWPAGTRFDSRFNDGAHRCHLCGKPIEKSGRVPVNTRPGSGVVHGMYVGQDCARKFLAVTIKREDTSIMED